MGTLAMPASPISAEQKIRAKSVEEVLPLALAFGETVLCQANVLRRIAAPLFESAVLVLTDRRLLLLTPAFPTGYELKAAYPSAECHVVNQKMRFDGSRIVAVHTETDRNLSFYFGRVWRQQAETICQALTSSDSPPGDMDGIAAVEEFLGLETGPDGG